jgi:hypothetical protein
MLITINRGYPLKALRPEILGENLERVVTGFPNSQIDAVA